MKFGLVKKTIFLASIVWGFWSIYAVSLGLRWFFHWKGKRLAFYSPVALALVMLVMFYMAPFNEKNYHSGPFFPPYNLDSPDKNITPGSQNGTIPVPQDAGKQ
jgi:hypothetical protein